MRTISILALLGAWISTGYGVDRLWIDAKINGKPARLCFDTGSDQVVLLRKAAERLGLKITNPPSDSRQPPGLVALGETEECELTLRVDRTLGETTIKMPLAIVDSPAGVNWDVDGVVGWPTLSHNILCIDAENLALYSLASVSKQCATWTRFNVNVLTNSGILALEFPKPDAGKGIILVDTGSFRGVELPPQEWREWRAAHADQPATLQSNYDPAGGWEFQEEAWAKKLSFGPLVLASVPVQQADQTSIVLGSSQYAGTLGLAALKRLDLVIDGQRGVAYVRSKDTPPPPYDYNRLGAVFIPRDAQSNNRVAHVLAGTPAYNAGIQDGDVLLKIDGADVTTWRSDPRAEVSQVFQRPVGTKIHLRLRRGNQTFKTTAVLEDILSPEDGWPVRVQQALH